MVESTATSQKPITLYSYWRSGASWRVRIVLFLKGYLGSDIEYIPVNLVEKEQHSASYKERSESRMLPTLIIRDPKLSDEEIVLQESLPICEFLEEVYPEKTRLMPTDPIKRHQVRRLCEVINSNTQPI